MGIYDLVGLFWAVLYNSLKIIRGQDPKNQFWAQKWPKMHFFDNNSIINIWKPQKYKTSEVFKIGGISIHTFCPSTHQFKDIGTLKSMSWAKNWSRIGPNFSFSVKTAKYYLETAEKNKSNEFLQRGNTSLNNFGHPLHKCISHWNPKIHGFGPKIGPKLTFSIKIAK